MRIPGFVLLNVAICLIFTSNVSGQVKKWTIQECVQYALENNISIRNSVLDTLDAEVDRQDAFGNFLPSANASALLLAAEMWPFVARWTKRMRGSRAA